VTLTIGGENKISLLQVSSIHVTDVLNSRNTCNFTLIEKTGEYRPVVGEEVIITVSGTKIFAGTIDVVVEQTITQAGSEMYYFVTCVDYNQICDRHTVAEVYDNEAVDDIIKDIVDTCLADEGITYANVEPGPTIEKAVFVYRYVNDVFNELSDITGCDWYIDYDKDLHFFARESNVAPEEITDESKNYRRISIEKTREQYRNRQHLRAGNDITDERTESFTGDGEVETFTLKFPVAKVPTSITVDSGGGPVAKTIGIRGVDTDKDWYWNKNYREITQDDSGTTLTNADTLAVTYQGFFPIRIRVDKEDEISDRAAVEGGSGIYEHIEDDQSIEDRTSAEDKAMGLLRRYGTIPEIVRIETDTAGFKAGQLLTIDISKHNLSGKYLIRSVSTSEPTKDYLRYEIEALSGENIGGWVDFFRRLVQAGKKYVIRENEVLIRIIGFSETVTISDSLSVSSAAPESRIGYAMIGFCEVS
jgi:hypothetical protein